MLLTRDQILSVSDLPYEDVEVPEWGGTVRVRTLTGTERDHLEVIHNEVGMRGFRSRLAAASICDETLRPVFSEADIKALAQKSSLPLVRIAGVAMRLSKLGKEDVETARGNSSASPSDDSSSDSLSSSGAPSENSSPESVPTS